MVRSRRNVNRKAICAVNTYQTKHNDSEQVIIYSQNIHGIFESTKQSMQMINRAYEFLHEYFERR